MKDVFKRLVAMLMILALMVPALAVAQEDEKAQVQSNEIDIVFDLETAKMGDTLNVSWKMPEGLTEIDYFWADWIVAFNDGTSKMAWYTEEVCESASFEITEGTRGIFYVGMTAKDGTDYWGQKEIVITGTPEVKPMSINITPSKEKVAVGEEITFDIDLVNVVEPVEVFSYSTAVYLGETANRSIDSGETYKEKLTYTVTEGSRIELHTYVEGADGRSVESTCTVDITGYTGTMPAIEITSSKANPKEGEQFTINWKFPDRNVAYHFAYLNIEAYDFDGNGETIATFENEDAMVGTYSFDAPYADTVWVYAEIGYEDSLYVNGELEIDIENAVVPVRAVYLYPGDIVIGKGQKVSTVTPQVYPENATDKSLVWTSSDEKVATVDANGKIKGVGKGKATITATSVSDPDVSDSIVVEVVGKNKGVKKITLSKKKASLKVGKSLKLKVTFNPAKPADKSLSWMTSDENVATVNGNGKVTAVGVGKATITAMSSSGKTATCVVTVKEAKVTKITIEGDKKMKKGETQQLTAIVKPDKAANKDVKWKSSDTKIATVDENGVVTALKKGTVTITATARDGSKVKGKIVIKIKKK